MQFSTGSFRLAGWSKEGAKCVSTPQAIYRVTNIISTQRVLWRNGSASLSGGEGSRFESVEDRFFLAQFLDLQTSP
jgi:hypothetical protein